MWLIYETMIEQRVKNNRILKENTWYVYTHSSLMSFMSSIKK